jgi:hypothetical protein
MATILNATIQDGMDQGLTIGEHMLLGRTVTIDGQQVRIDRAFIMRKRIEEAQKQIGWLSDEIALYEAELGRIGG